MADSTLQAAIKGLLAATDVHWLGKGIATFLAELPGKEIGLSDQEQKALASATSEEIQDAIRQLDLTAYNSAYAAAGVKRIEAGILNIQEYLQRPIDAPAKTTPRKPDPESLKREIIDFSSERNRHEKFFGREDVLAKINQWIDAEVPDRGWVLVTGTPGMGKSAILSEFLKRREKTLSVKVPHFFLRHGVENWDHPDVIRRALAAQIEKLYPDLADPDAQPESRLRELLDRVSEKVLVPQNTRLVLVVDGLDEADCSDGKGNPLPLFLPYTLPLGVFVVCASRPRYPHLYWLESRDHIHRIDLNDHQWSGSNRDACVLFWNHWAPCFSPPLNDEFVQIALERGENNLLYAVKLQQYWLDLPEQERRVERIPTGMEGFLGDIWDRLQEQNPEILDSIHRGLGLLCTAREALPISILSELLGWEDLQHEEAFLRATRPFLLAQPAHWEGEKAYRLYHDSFREFVEEKLQNKRIQGFHSQLAGSLACWPCDITDTFRYQYALCHGIVHRVRAREWEEVRQLCCDVGYLEQRCRAQDIYSLENDLEMAARQMPEDHARDAAEAIHRVICQESQWLRTYPSELPSLLYNRLLSSQWPEEKIPTTLSFPDGLPLPRLRYPVFLGGQEVRNLRGHGSAVSCCAVSPNGHTLVSVSWDRTLKVWDLATGQCTNTLEGHEGYVTSCAVSPDGRTLVSASWDHTLKMWELDTGKCTHTLEGHQDGVTSCTVSPDGQTIVSASRDTTLKVWDLETGTLRKTLKGHQDGVNWCTVNPDGRTTVSASDDRTLKVWNLDTGKCTNTFEGHEDGVTSCTVGPDRRTIVSASDDRTLKVWDLDTGKCTNTLEGHKDGVTSCTVSPDGRTIVSASWDKTLKVWDMDTGKCFITLEGHSEGVRSCTVSPDGRTIISASFDRTLKVWNLNTGSCTNTPKWHKDNVTSCTMSPDGRIIVSASFDRTLKVWDLDSGSCTNTLEEHIGWVRFCTLSPDGRTVVSASWDGTLKVWDLETGKCTNTLEGHEGWITSCTVSPDGRTLFSTSSDKTLNVWNLDTGKCTNTLKGHGSVVTSCAVSPDGCALVSASYDQTLMVWELATGTLRYTLEGHDSAVTSCTVSPDGHILVSASGDRTLKVWDLATGTLRNTLEGHEDWVSSCSVSPDGRTLVSASSDRTLKVWNLTTGRCINTVCGAASFRTVAISEHNIVAGDSAGNVWMLDYRNNGAIEEQTEMKSTPVRVFISYSHKDEKHREELEKHLSLLKRQDAISVWHDRKIITGDEWKGKIDDNLDGAEVILLLISSDFLASDYCYDIEMKRALERHDNGEARVIPIILRPCDWKSSPFAKLQGLPTDGKPVTRWDDSDEAWLDVTNGLRRLIEEFTSGQ